MFGSLPRGVALRMRLLSLRLLGDVALAAFRFCKNAFPQPEKLWAQSLAAKLTLETDHLVTRLTGAQPCQRRFVAPAHLLLRHRQGQKVGRRRIRRRTGQVLPFSFSPCRLDFGLCPPVIIPAPLASVAFQFFPFGRSKFRALLFRLALGRLAFRPLPFGRSELCALLFPLALGCLAFRPLPFGRSEFRALLFRLALGCFAFRALPLELSFAG